MFTTVRELYSMTANKCIETNRNSQITIDNQSRDTVVVPTRLEQLSLLADNITGSTLCASSELELSLLTYFFVVWFSMQKFDKSMFLLSDRST
jgi:hypothetical protein